MVFVVLYQEPGQRPDIFFIILHCPCSLACKETCPGNLSFTSLTIPSLILGRSRSQHREGLLKEVHIRGRRPNEVGHGAFQTETISRGII